MSNDAILKLPSKLNFGSGKDWKEDFLNVDIQSLVNPDVVCDLCSSSLYHQTHHSRRFGSFSFQKGMFTQIVAYDVLEHLPDLVTAMTNCLDLLAIDGEFHIKVPYDLSLGAWQDPTHVRAFNENSWLYYTQWYWYLGWKEARFAIKSFTFIPTSFGEQLKNQGLSIDEISRTPRAIDSMHLILVKESVQDISTTYFSHDGQV